MPVSSRYAAIPEQEQSTTTFSKTLQEAESFKQSDNTLPARARGLLPRRIPFSVVGIIGLFSLLFFLMNSSQRSHELGSLKDWRGKVFKSNGIPVNFESYTVEEGEWSCNPFQQAGRLIVDVLNPTKNIWRPWEELVCPGSTLMAGLWKDPKKPKSILKGIPSLVMDGVTSNPYSWLQDRNILLQGDSMERLHLTDFCNLIGGNLTNINPSHPASPPVFRRPPPTIFDSNGIETIDSIAAKIDRMILEDAWDNRPASWFYTRPWLCEIPEFNATVTSVFTWGMQDMESVFQTEEFFHGPSTWIERFEHITKPLLKNLAILLDRPSILHPDFIELGSGFWDLRGFTEQDFIAQNIPKPYPMDSPIPFGNIGEEREKKWSIQAREVIETVARYFPGDNDGAVKDGPVISWRTLHHPKRNNYTPYSRAFPLDQLARHTLHKMRKESFLSRPPPKSSTSKLISKIRGGGEKESKYEDLGFDERIRVGNYGALMTGQEEHFKDFLHPDILPGSYLWSDMFMYEVKRAMLRIGRSKRLEL